MRKKGLFLTNGVGTGDPDYRGSYRANFYNFIDSRPNYEVGDRIIQIVFPHGYEINWIVVDELSDTERGEGGFGSTGK